MTTQTKSSYTIIEDGAVTSPKGFVAAAAATGMKKSGAYDVTLIVSESDCTAAGVFTKNVVAAAPVLLDKATLAANQTRIRGVVANAKNANACTGEPGLEDAKLMQSQAAELLDCTPDQFFVLSTGVIGQRLPLDKIGDGIAISALNLGDHGLDAAKAIMTTDLVAKHVAVTVSLLDGDVTIGGIAKGSGMIHPNMATMLGVITTDAGIASVPLQNMLSEANNRSFNRISVDGDTSTNDTVLLLANGESGVQVSSVASVKLFQEALDYVCTELAQMIVRDGEGATKFAEIQVEGAADEAAAHQIANTIATSPLVKTALAGSDANWGRILAAAGRAGIEFNQFDCALWVSDDGDTWLQLLANGTPTDYAEADAAAIFAKGDIYMKLSVGAGDGATKVWATDLTHDYISINADYRS